MIRRMVFLVAMGWLVACNGAADDDDAADDDSGGGDDDVTDGDDDVTGDDDDAADDDASDDDVTGDDDDATTDGPLAALWAGSAHFEVDQDPVPVTDPTSGHREAFAVNRPDIGAQTVYLYHRCFGQGSDASICLSMSHDGGDTYAEFHGQVMGPQPGHIFAVAPAVVEVNGTWTMVYEESNVAAVYWAESSDGITWTSRGQLIDHGGGGDWDQGAIATPGALVDDFGMIHVTYAGFPLGGANMDIGVASGTSMENLSKNAYNPVFPRTGGGWDGGQVSMGRLIEEDGWIYMVYEGADTDFSCEPSNRYGWGMARTQNWVQWERHPGNPFGLSAQSPYGCGNDMPSIWRRYDGEIFVFHTSEDTTRIVREHLAVD
jgi:hypothetical protein